MFVAAEPRRVVSWGDEGGDDRLKGVGSKGMNGGGSGLEEEELATLGGLFMEREKVEGAEAVTRGEGGGGVAGGGGWRASEYKSSQGLILDSPTMSRIVY